MNVHRINQSHAYIHRHHCGSSRRDERKRNSDNRSYSYHHSDIENTMSEQQSEHTHAYELTELVSCENAVVKNFRAYHAEHSCNGHTADKAESLSYI